MAKTRVPAVKAGEHMNLRSLATYLGLSQTTISLVLNNSPAGKSIPKETRQRVLDAARKFHYRPNYFARSLRKSKSMSVGVLAPDLSEGYFTLVMSGVEQKLLRAHYFYFTANHYWRKELLEEYPRMMMERAVDGFLLLNTPADFTVPVPVVAISAHRNVEGVTNIVLDHYRAAHLALKHLYDHGHREIAFMRGPEFIVDSEFRWQGIQQVAAELGITIQPELSLCLTENSWSPEFGYKPVEQLLAKNRAFTAIMCFNDISAIGAIRAIQDAGLRVPEDISVIGFDDIISAGYYKPSLSTVRQPLLEMGRRGAELLLDRIAHTSKSYPAEVIMQPELIVRESTAAANKQQTKARKAKLAG
jgi:DNA-binding LacI/PurR family transcriptional regulator